MAVKVKRIAVADVNGLRGILPSEVSSFFADDELKAALQRADGDANLAAYELLIGKSDDTGISLSGLSLADNSAYWTRLAAMYRPSFTRVV